MKWQKVQAWLEFFVEPFKKKLLTDPNCATTVLNGTCNGRRRIPNIPEPTNGLRCVLHVVQLKAVFVSSELKKVLVSAVALQLALGWKAYDPYFTVIFLVLIREQNVASPP